jgi:hypothetical protein
MKVRRVPWLDEYVEGGESAVLIEDQVFVLSPLATTLLAAIGDSVVDVAEVAGVLGDTFGAPPDGADLVDATEVAVRELAARGLVTYSL